MDLELRARAAAATLEVVFGFNPGQKRGPDGRWIKMGGAGSAGGRRGKPIERLLGGGYRDLDGRELRRVKAVFEMQDAATGLRSAIRQATVEPDPFNTGQNQLTVQLDIIDSQGNPVGKAKRTISREAGGYEVRHDRFRLLPSYRNGGFSSRWLRRTEDEYRRMGIDRITLQTDSVGGYAWAKAGFDFRDDKYAQYLGDQVELYAEEMQAPSPEVRQQLDELIRRTQVGGGQRPLPVEFAMLGWEPGAKTWFGKESMVGTGWEGVKQL